MSFRIHENRKSEKPDQIRGRRSGNRCVRLDNYGHTTPVRILARVCHKCGFSDANRASDVAFRRFLTISANPETKKASVSRGLF